MQQRTLSDKNDKQHLLNELAIDSIVILDTRHICCGVPPCKTEYEP